MTSHDLTLAVYVFIGVTALSLQVLGSTGRSRIPSLGAVFSSVMHARSTRIGVVAGWMWLGLHLFAR
jgi:hypothetical protein